MTGLAGQGQSNIDNKDWWTIYIICDRIVYWTSIKYIHIIILCNWRSWLLSVIATPFTNAWSVLFFLISVTHCQSLPDLPRSAVLVPSPQPCYPLEGLVPLPSIQQIQKLLQVWGFYNSIYLCQSLLILQFLTDSRFHSFRLS